VVIDQGIGGVGTPGSRVVTPAQTTTYTLTATGCGGTTTQQAIVTVNPAAPPPGGGYWGQSPTNTPPPPQIIVQPTIIYLLLPDLAITDIYLDKPTGDTYIKYMNNSAFWLTGYATWSCAAVQVKTPGGGSTNPNRKQSGSFSVNLDKGRESALHTSLYIGDLYLVFGLHALVTVQCSIEGKSFTDFNPSNNTLQKDVGFE
jgi:hypothetical protein